MGLYVPAPPAEAPNIPGYRITGEIAKGGMGCVYAGYDLTLDREVAIKTLLPGAYAERFVTEAKITARLPHPNIPPVHALGTLADGTPWLAMKLLRDAVAKGFKDAAHLKKNSDLDPLRGREDFQKLVEALAAGK
jgi:serine/threonine protein kinase